MPRLVRLNRSRSVPSAVAMETVRIIMFDVGEGGNNLKSPVCSPAEGLLPVSAVLRVASSPHRTSFLQQAEEGAFRLCPFPRAGHTGVTRKRELL